MTGAADASWQFPTPHKKTIYGSPNIDARSAVMKRKLLLDGKAAPNNTLPMQSGEHCSSAISPLRWKNRDEAENHSSLPCDCCTIRVGRLELPDDVNSADRVREIIGEHAMPLTTVIIAIVGVGLVLWLINRFIPMQGQIKSILNGLVVIVLVLWVGNLFGVFDHLRHIRVGH